MLHIISDQIESGRGDERGEFFNQFEGLENHVGGSVAPAALEAITSSSAERSLRGIAVGRRNWSFFGSDNGSKTAAILTTITTTCKRLGVDPFDYLRDVFQRISTHPRHRVDELLPDKWRATRLPPPSAEPFSSSIRDKVM